ncbi:hypothetical protein [Magnetospira sp. QH-2]|uniref:hypothetical protein n=1 Tax=Magnetospira sp. (strain QH-2) TaxID=1288970 RepID=UPI0003E80C59|nr:hypothetical protein [Magnetospira sp. QH-2]CCQ72348.1 conserved protein of unknown function (conserved among Magnetospirillum) [Magnetospira sp. QH-2]
MTMNEGMRRDWKEGDAIVGFVAHTDIWWLSWLRPGFRHCFVLVKEADGWVLCDPLSHQTVVRRWPIPSGLGTLVWLHENGYRLAVTKVREAPKRMAPFRLYTCVESVKRVLGLHNRWILTPWQLFRYLIRQG